MIVCHRSDCVWSCSCLALKIGMVSLQHSLHTIMHVSSVYFPPCKLPQILRCWQSAALMFVVCSGSTLQTILVLLKGVAPKEQPKQQQQPMYLPAPLPPLMPLTCQLSNIIVRLRCLLPMPQHRTCHQPLMTHHLHQCVCLKLVGNHLRSSPSCQFSFDITATC